MAPQRRRHRPVHQPALWSARAGCVLALGGVLVLGLFRPPPPVDVDSLTAAQDRRVCALVESFIDVAFVGVSPAPDATPDDFAATVRINTALAQMSETLRESVREMGC